MHGTKTLIAPNDSRPIKWSDDLGCYIRVQSWRAHDYDKHDWDFVYAEDRDAWHRRAADRQARFAREKIQSHHDHILRSIAARLRGDRAEAARLLTAASKLRLWAARLLTVSQANAGSAV